MTASAGGDDGQEQSPEHHLLIPKIHQLAISRTTDLVFAPTLPHLRAYLSTFSLQEKIGSQSHFVDQEVPSMIIYGLLELHHDTSEMSAQGLSRTFALAAEASTRSCMKLIIVEPSRTDPGGVSSQPNSSESESITDPWKSQIPLLNGSIRFGGEDRVWAGKTIQAAQVAGRWCRFVRADSFDINHCLL